ncbi:MAG: YggS family pyridoxal phosphate-dependent enzyme [Chloroflexi bacterium]|jgi:pyridoxal phosphate enzyme (YggS family)|nr:YggS family pyridoxal phosphate-dependent enzyme [Chloroflexota bacterium]
MAALSESELRTNLERVEQRILQACQRAGRRREDITLVAVSKTRSLDEIAAVYQQGIRHFGENRVEEAEGKIPVARERLAPDPVTWHMIGHLQSRKAATAAGLFDMIQSVDSNKLANRLNRLVGEIEPGTKLPILLEVNVSGEASKYGYAAWDDAGRAAFIQEARQLAECEHLLVRGLMTMAPIVEDQEQARPVFRKLRELRDALREAAPYSTWPDLSMGMTDDYPVAIEEGATIIRVGRAIFGPSTY